MHALVRWMAPSLSFTAEEIWQLLPGSSKASIFTHTWYDQLQAMPVDAKLSAASFQVLMEVRDASTKALEPLRAAKTIGSSLDAEVVIYADSTVSAAIAPALSELRFFLLTSDSKFAALQDAPVDLVRIQTSAGELAVSATVSAQIKCVRCWHHRSDVGSIAAHPELCARCVDNVDGKGEHRECF
jgi:isoleucyl-tRNA synthetase